MKLYTVTFEVETDASAKELVMRSNWLFNGKEWSEFEVVEVKVEPKRRATRSRAAPRTEVGGG